MGAVSMNRRVVLPGLALAVALEALTLLLRFGARLESSRDTASTIGVLTFGIRIHHGYLGLLALGVGWLLCRRAPGWARWLLIAGIGLVLSDAIHHFLVLWPILGDPQFHLVYPAAP